ncbi:hypothetical protein ABZS66_60205 [Dactylosporangium sp. NPDC005572]|uniref:hypothetical protein n=1 Tax=Dactylosporangium sp. NPDC005572 TaxID=3156889 RepID=UPI0033B9FD2E
METVSAEQAAAALRQTEIARAAVARAGVRPWHLPTLAALSAAVPLTGLLPGWAAVPVLLLLVTGIGVTIGLNTELTGVRGRLRAGVLLSAVPVFAGVLVAAALVGHPVAWIAAAAACAALVLAAGALIRRER